MKNILTLALALALAANMNAQNPNNLGTLAPKGKFKVIRIYDGDTFTIMTDNGKRFNIRINGIDAPERSQEYGLYSRHFLVQLIDNQAVTIVPLEIDKWGRTVATCYNVDGKDISYEMLINGMAWHYSDYDNTEKYIKAEMEARYMTLGIWGNPNTINPQTFRSLNRIQKMKYK